MDLKRAHCESPHRGSQPLPRSTSSQSVTRECSPLQHGRRPAHARAIMRNRTLSFRNWVSTVLSDSPLSGRIETCEAQSSPIFSDQGVQHDLRALPQNGSSPTAPGNTQSLVASPGITDHRRHVTGRNHNRTHQSCLRFGISPLHQSPSRLISPPIADESRRKQDTNSAPKRDE